MSVFLGKVFIVAGNGLCHWIVCTPVEASYYECIIC